MLVGLYICYINRGMKRLFPITLIVLITLNGILSAQEETGPNLGMSQQTVTDSTNIHYTGKYCSECHEKEPEKGRGRFLKFNGDFTQLCKCHGYTTESYIHPIDIAPSEEKKARMPINYPLRNGKMTCVTCHDIYLQCQDNQKLKQVNKRFLRDAPYRKRTDLCIKCHDEKKYKMLNPHNQLNANGEIIVEKCLFCHEEKPDEKHSTFKEVKLIGDLIMLCQRCHGERRDHPARADHIRKPSAETIEIMKAGEREFNISLPLDQEGKIFCATCHNPHEKGVIPAELAGAKGGSEKLKHRLPGQMCRACHQK